jgi:hypothetical protein
MAGNNNAKLWREAVSATSDCPSIEVLEKIMDSSFQTSSAAASADIATDASRNLAAIDEKTIAHVRQCPHCQSEISMLRSFESATPSADEGAAVAWIAAQLERNPQVRGGSQLQQRSSSVASWRNFFRIPYMAAAAALVLAAALGISLYVSENSRPSFNPNYGVSPMRSGSIRLTGPSGNLTQPPSQFTWEAWPGAASYNVKLTGMDIDHTLVWQGTSSQNSLALSPEVKALIRPGKPLELTVTALDSAGRPLASGKDHFRIALK